MFKCVELGGVTYINTSCSSLLSVNINISFVIVLIFTLNDSENFKRDEKKWLLRAKLDGVNEKRSIIDRN